MMRSQHTSRSHSHKENKEEQLYSGYDQQGHWKTGNKEDWRDEASETSGARSTGRRSDSSRSRI